MGGVGRGGRGGWLCVVPMCSIRNVSTESIACRLWLDRLIGFAGQWPQNVTFLIYWITLLATWQAIFSNHASFHFSIADLEYKQPKKYIAVPLLIFIAEHSRVMIILVHLSVQLSHLVVFNAFELTWKFQERSVVIPLTDIFCLWTCTFFSYIFSNRKELYLA